jgi:hypothetical protein
MVPVTAHPQHLIAVKVDEDSALRRANAAEGSGGRGHAASRRTGGNDAPNPENIILARRSRPWQWLFGQETAAVPISVPVLSRTQWRMAYEPQSHHESL